MKTTGKTLKTCTDRLKTSFAPLKTNVFPKMFFMLKRLKLSECRTLGHVKNYFRLLSSAELQVPKNPENLISENPKRRLAQFFLCLPTRNIFRGFFFERLIPNFENLSFGLPFKLIDFEIEHKSFTVKSRFNNIARHSKIYR